MWSLKAGLRQIAAHLPPGFDPSHGIKSLFPGNSGAVSSLQNYVFCLFGQLTTYNDDDPENPYYGSGANAYLLADGMGRWFFSWFWWPITLSATYERQIGFAFRLSDGGSAHVFTDTSKPAQQTKSCNSGTDPWIANNWPSVFANGAAIKFFDLTTTDLSSVWGYFGFGKTDFIVLQGGSTACANTTSGSLLFPYPVQPNPQYSKLALALASMLATLGQILLHFRKGIKSHFTTKDGFSFHVTMPQGDSGTIIVDFSNANTGSNGTYKLTIPNGDISAVGQTTFPVANGSAQLNYTYSQTGTGGHTPPSGRLNYTADITDAGNDNGTLNGVAVDGQLISLVFTPDDGGSGSTTTFAAGPDGTVSVNGNAAPAAVAAAINALPIPDPSVAAAGIQPISSLLAGLASDWWKDPTSYGGATAYGFGGSTWAETSQGYVQSWGAGETQYGPALYNFVVTVDSNGNPTSISLTGTLTQAVGVTASGIITSTINIDTNTAQAYYDLQIPLSYGLVTLSETYNANADGTISCSSLTSVTYSAGGSSSESATWVGTTAEPFGTITSQQVTGTDADGNTSTVTYTLNPDGTSQLQIDTEDSNGNGTLETIDIDANGNTTNDETVSVSSGPSDDTQPIEGESFGGGSGGDDDEDETENDDDDGS